jgi:hypothetical protein
VPRDYAFEALAEVTGTDWEVGRGQLNAALRDIQKQSELTGYLLGAEIHERAKMYQGVFEGAALTPTALAKHWSRLPEEAKKLKRGGVNLHAPEPELERPVSSRERNLEEARKILAMFEK